MGTTNDLTAKLDDMIAELKAMHITMGALIDDVSELESTTHATMQEVRSLRVGLARMDARIRKLEARHAA